MTLKFTIQGGDFIKAGTASSEVKTVLKQLNISPILIKRIAVAMYEAEVNIVAHAYKGTMTATIDTTKVVLLFDDEGPGIADIEQAMIEGYSTATEAVRHMGFGAGMGLPNIKRNVNDMKISSTVGKGTRLELTINLV